MRKVQFHYLSNTDGQILIDGVPVFLPRSKKPFRYKLKQINDRVFVNGYEYCDGKWRHTLRAWAYYILG